MGDFNFLYINWENYLTVRGHGKEFLEVIDDCFLYQIVQKDCTRDNAIIDLVLTSSDYMVQNHSK